MRCRECEFYSVRWCDKKKHPTKPEDSPWWCPKNKKSSLKPSRKRR